MYVYTMKLIDIVTRLAARASLNAAVEITCIHISKNKSTPGAHHTELPPTE